MKILVLIILTYLLILILEKILLNRYIQSIPLRIAVTGTRGKSSVVRLLASVLRENGSKVLAKTTGSEAKYILPDGSESEVRRRGIPSIMEQKKLLRTGAMLHVDCMVAEIMSIHPENHYVESHQLLKPNIVLITNVHLDHIDALGKTRDEIASVFCLDIPENSKVFILEKENCPIFQSAVKKVRGELISVRQGISSALFSPSIDQKQIEFFDNLDIICAVGKYLKIDDKTMLNGIRKTKYDLGQLKIWSYHAEPKQKTIYFVNAFAANDPESTFDILKKLTPILPSASNNLVGLLNLRADRGDRTVQWIAALKNGTFNDLNKIFVMGAHAKIVKSKVKQVTILKEHKPEQITDKIFDYVADQTTIFGFGNIGGTGKLLIDYWNKTGDVYGV